MDHSKEKFDYWQGGRGSCYRGACEEAHLFAYKNKVNVSIVSSWA